MYEEIDIDIEDMYTDDEIEALRHQRQEDYYNAPLSSESLNLLDSDFF